MAHDLVLTEIEVAGMVLAALVRQGRVPPGADCIVTAHYDRAGRAKRTTVHVRDECDTEAGPTLRLVDNG